MIKYYYTTFDRQNNMIYDCAELNRDNLCDHIEESVPMTDEEMEEAHPWLKEQGREARFGKNLSEYDIYQWLRLCTPNDYMKITIKWIERNVHNSNLVARNSNGEIIRLINRSCFDILPT